MRIYRYAGNSRIALHPVDGAGSDIVKGALVMPGVTDETDRGVLVVASGAAADAAGIIDELHDYSVTGDTTMEDGAIYVKHRIAMLSPGDEVAAELANDADNDVDVAGFSTATATITDLEDDIDGSWMYVRAGPSVGLLAYIITSGSGSCVLKTTPTTALTTSSKVLIMRRRFHQTVSLNTAADKIASSAAAGSLPWRVLDIQYTYAGKENWESLDPTIHDNQILPVAINPRFRLILSPADTLLNPLD